jgi:hypothetical protein
MKSWRISGFIKPSPRLDQAMTSTSELDALLALAKRLEAERQRIARMLAAAPADGALDEGLLRRLAVVHGAITGVAAEIELHAPALGRGGET